MGTHMIGIGREDDQSSLKDFARIGGAIIGSRSAADQQVQGQRLYVPPRKVVPTKPSVPDWQRELRKEDQGNGKCNRLSPVEMGLGSVQDRPVLVPVHQPDQGQRLYVPPRNVVQRKPFVPDWRIELLEKEELANRTRESGIELEIPLLIPVRPIRKLAE